MKKNLKLNERIDLLVRLGNHLKGKDEYMEALMQRTAYNNPWFTVENQKEAIASIAEKFLDRKKLEKWLSLYNIPEETELKTVGLVLAGNIPLVGFHDLLCVFVAGHRAAIKMSEKDRFLLPYLIKVLERFDSRSADYFTIVERLKDYDAVIATGSNNSARYFESYFSAVPHIIRRNRNGIAVLTGKESRQELVELGKDVFRYFGLGCRNVSKVYVPEGYDFDPLLEALHDYREIVLHNKYKNNFDYNFAFHVLNKTPYINNGCIIMTENKSMNSRIGELYYEFYGDVSDVEQEVEQRKEEIQVVVAPPDTLQAPSFPFGKAQEPELWDYADGVDTMAFLLKEV